VGVFHAVKRPEMWSEIKNKRQKAEDASKTESNNKKKDSSKIRVSNLSC